MTTIEDRAKKDKGLYGKFIVQRTDGRDEPGEKHAENKYGAKRTWSELAQREFASKAEAARAEELVLLERAGDIRELEFQPSWVLCERPRITYTADFRYLDNRRQYTSVEETGRVVTTILDVVEDVKGVLARDTRTKIAWLLYAKGVKVTLLRQTRGGFEEVAWLGRERKTKQRRKP